MEKTLVSRGSKGAGLLVVGINHRSAAIELREKLAISAHELPNALRELNSNSDIGGAVVLSTCNRIEFYITSANPSAALPVLADYLSLRGHLSPATVKSNLYSLEGEDAVRHLFRVAAGLDSMILGESEVMAQVKQAYLSALSNGMTNPVLNRLFQKALHSAKVLRSKTHIAKGQASIGSVVVKLANEIFEDRLENCDVLLWGAGKAAEVTARHLMKAGIRQIWVVNRTQAKSQDLAALCQGGWLSWDRAVKHLAHVDIAVVCTQAPHYVVDREDLAAILPQRDKRPLCLIDLAVPRNVEPAISELTGVRLYNIDDLQSIAQGALVRRHEQIEHCEALIGEQVGYFGRCQNYIPRKAASLQKEF